jgi:phytoene/squalene synthetase
MMTNKLLSLGSWRRAFTAHTSSRKLFSAHAINGHVQSHYKRRQSTAEAITKEEKPEPPSSEVVAKQKEKVEQAFTACSNLLKEKDAANFKCMQYLPTGKRSACTVVRALNNELWRVRLETVDENAAKMKLAWWAATMIDIVEGIRPAANLPPVVQAAYYVIHHHKLNGKKLGALLTGHDRLVGHFGGTIEEIESIGEQTESMVLYFMLQIVEGKESEEKRALDTVAHAGAAAQLVQLIQTIPLALSGQKYPLPQKLVQTHGLYDPALMRRIEKGEVVPELKAAVKELAERAQLRLDSAHKSMKKLPRASRLVFDPWVCALVFL